MKVIHKAKIWFTDDHKPFVCTQTEITSMVPKIEAMKTGIPISLQLAQALYKEYFMERFTIYNGNHPDGEYGMDELFRFIKDLGYKIVLTSDEVKIVNS